MTLKVVRVTDPVSCGDRLGQGSSNVFANNLAVGRITQDNTAGHCFTPTQATRPGYTVFVNNKPIMLEQISSIIPHCCPGSGCHGGVYINGSPNVFAEGGIADYEIPDALAAQLGIDKQAYTDACIKLTFGHLGDRWDDHMSDDPDAQVDDVQKYNNEIPERPITDPNAPIPPGLTPAQARKYDPPVKLTNNYEQDKRISDGTARTSSSTPAGVSDEDGGKMSTLKKTKLDQTPPPAQRTPSSTPISGGGADIDNHEGPWARDFPLSPHFVLGQFAMGYNSQPRVKKYPIPQTWKGLTDKQIVSNLRLLCVNVLEPLYDHFPSVMVNSGFRMGTDNSKHNFGMAADMFVPEIQRDGEALYQGALWIRDNLRYDQFIFETQGRDVWYHLAYLSSGNRQMTMTTTTGGAPYVHKIFKIPR